MQTIKLKYHVNNPEDKSLIKEYQRQYSNLLRWMYNRCIDGVNGTNRKQLAKSTLNNIPLMDCWFIDSASMEAAAKKAASPDKHIIFGGKSEFIRRCKGLITNEEWKEAKLQKLCSIGEANQKGNRKFKLTESLTSVIFKPCKSTHIELIFNGISKSYHRILEKLYSLQEGKITPITYYLDSEYVYITFDECIFSITKQREIIKNRVMAIDMNPNYIGWSIVDWHSSSQYRIVKSGVYSIKPINDKSESLIKQHLSPEDKQRVYINNKRKHEVFEISKNLINKAIYYKCELFSVEQLDIVSKNNKKGKKYNRLVNNNWNRNALVNNLKKRCNVCNIKLFEVIPNYSSFVGNVIYRKHGLPDMVLSSIEVGRRGYEFNRQYITKEIEEKKNIQFPIMEDFYEDYSKSLEEFGMSEKSINYKELYEQLKNSKIRYRVPFDENQKFFRCFSKRSRLLKYDY